ncbi:MAG: DUF2807 domain-containing protein [Spirochaetales bacterium]|nr:DUF2807 domain-containing protein [Spirochaetales bacterium]
MKNKIRLVSLLVLAAALSACSLFNQIKGSGVAVETTYDYQDFSSVSINETCKLDVTRGDSFSVILTSDDNITEYLEVTQSDGTLSIGLESGHSYSNIIFEASVIMPDLAGLSADGASEAAGSGFSSEAVNISVNGASEITMNYNSTGTVTAAVDGASNLTLNTQIISGNVEFNCNGASTIDFSADSGRTNANLKIDGASAVDMRDFTAADVRVDIDGASDAWVNMNGTLSGSLNGASELYYRGSPTIGDLSIETASRLSTF